MCENNNDSVSSNGVLLWIDDTRDVLVIQVTVVNAEHMLIVNWNRVNEIQAGQSLTKLKMWDSVVKAD